MDEIIRGTTPSFYFQDFGFDAGTITAATFLVLQGGAPIIKKALPEASVLENSVRWTLTQQDTLQLDASKPATIRCKWKAGGLCGVSESLTLEVRNFGDDEVL